MISSNNIHFVSNNFCCMLPCKSLCKEINKHFCTTPQYNRIGPFNTWYRGVGLRPDTLAETHTLRSVTEAIPSKKTPLSCISLNIPLSKVLALCDCGSACDDNGNPTFRLLFTSNLGDSWKYNITIVLANESMVAA